MTSYQDFTLLTGGPATWQLRRMVAERSCGVCGRYRDPRMTTPLPVMTKRRTKATESTFVTPTHYEFVRALVCDTCAGSNGHGKESA